MRFWLRSLLSVSFMLCCFATAFSQDRLVTPNSGWLPPQLNLSDRFYGWEGPLVIAPTYSDEFGFLMHLHYAGIMGEKNAFSIAGNIGAKEFMVAAGWGYRLTPHQYIKISGQALRQRIPFHFNSGRVSDWLWQTAAGGAYQYLIRRGMFKRVYLGGYYARAESKTLDPVTNITTNFRHIAAAQTAGGHIGLTLLPWWTTELSGEINYDRAHYNQRFGHVPDESGLGGTISAVQLFGHQIKAYGMASWRSIYDQYRGGVDYLFPTRPGMRLVFGAFVSYVNGDIPTDHDTRGGVHVTIAIGGNPEGPVQHYNLANSDHEWQNALDWVKVPAVDFPQVLVAVDQSTV